MELVLRVKALSGPGGPRYKSEIDYREVAALVRRAIDDLSIGEASGSEWSLELVTLGPHDTSGWGDEVHLRCPPQWRRLGHGDPAVCGRAKSAETTGVPAFVTCLHCRSTDEFHRAEEIFWSQVEH